MKKDIENKVQDCTACLASGKNLKYQLPKKHYEKLEKLSEPGRESQIDFTGKLHNKHLHGGTQILIAVDRFSKWPTVKICKSAETKEVINFLTSNFNLYGIPEKIKSDKGGGHSYRKNTKNFAIIETSKFNIVHSECIRETEQWKEQYKRSKI